MPEEPRISATPPVYAYLDYPANVAIRNACAQLGLSIPRYAALIDTSPGTVGDWFRGKTRPPRVASLLTQLMCESPHVMDLLIAKSPPTKRKPRGKSFSKR